MRLTLVALLACCLLLSACVDEACVQSPVSPTGTGEHAGSSSEPGRTISIGITYSIGADATPSWTPDPELVIGAGRAGAHAVALQTQKIIAVDGVKANEAFAVVVRGAFLGTCTWNGVVRNFFVDLSIVVRPHASTPDTYLLSCTSAS